MKRINNIQTPIPISATHGYCRTCKTYHSLPLDPALPYCRDLMDRLVRSTSIAFRQQDLPDPKLSTEYLFGEARGKMLGILVAQNNIGEHKVLYAFSGQYNGLWQVPGWTPPLFDLQYFHKVHDDREREIKKLTRKLAQTAPHTEQFRTLRLTRKQLSRDLMQDIFALYRLRNFRGDTVSLQDAFIGTGLPTGTGDCCAPKLLVSAARQSLMPIAMAEFYWGRSNKSGTRRHGHIYPSCVEKCQPLLGYLLCGCNHDLR
jgi:hypothetical protein